MTASQRVDEARAALALTRERIGAFEQQRRQTAADRDEYARLGAALVRERDEEERLTLLLQAAEADERKAVADEKRDELERMRSAFAEKVELFGPLASEYAGAMVVARRAKQALESAAREATAHRKRTRQLAQELGEQLELDERHLDSLAHAHVIAALHRRSRDGGSEQLRGFWTTATSTADECAYEMRKLLGAPVHTTPEEWPTEQQIADMLSGAYLAKYNALQAVRNSQAPQREDAAHEVFVRIGDAE